MNQACLSNRCVGRSVETRPGLGWGQGGSPRPSKQGGGTQGDRSGDRLEILALGPSAACDWSAISFSDLPIVLCVLFTCQPASTTRFKLLDPAIHPRDASTAKSASRLFIAFVIT
jgi:hypothetical protein